MLAEYSSLRDELRSNRQYVFERPLLHSGQHDRRGVCPARGYGDAVHSHSVLGGPALPPLVHVQPPRERHSILAYIQVVLEGSTAHSWIGWERSLSAYRWWRHQARRLGVTTKPEPRSVVSGRTACGSILRSSGSTWSSPFLPSLHLRSMFWQPERSHIARRRPLRLPATRPLSCHWQMSF